MPSVPKPPKPRLKPGHSNRRQHVVLAKNLRRRSYLLPASLLLATAFVTTLIGMRCMYNFRIGQLPLTSFTDLFPYIWGASQLHLFASGLPFSMTIISILVANDFGRYFACRHFGVVPTIPLLWPTRLLTVPLRAFNRSKAQTDSRIASRSAIIAISAAGPVTGFTVAAATTCYGLVHSKTIAPYAALPLIHLAAPGVLSVLRTTLLPSFPDIPPILQMLPHPVLVASWIGLLITAIRLIPVGRSDGGRIVYAISPRLHLTTSTIVLAVLLYLGTVEWIGWLIAAAILLMSSLGLPRRAETAPTRIEWLALAPVCAAIFLLTISTQPILGMNLVQVIVKIPWGISAH